MEENTLVQIKALIETLVKKYHIRLNFHHVYLQGKTRCTLTGVNNFVFFKHKTPKETFDFIIKMYNDQNIPVPEAFVKQEEKIELEVPPQLSLI